VSKRVEAAKFILAEARAAGIRVGTDGTEVVLRIPFASRRTFEIAVDEHRTEIIEIIMAENAK
jgi:hypothetical protein